MWEELFMEHHPKNVARPRKGFEAMLDKAIAVLALLDLLLLLLKDLRSKRK